MIVKFKKIVWIISACLAAAIVVFGVVAWKMYSDRYRPNIVLASETDYLLIPHGTDYKALKDSLTSKAKLIRPESFDRIANKEKLHGHIKSGRYLLRNGMNNITLVRRIILHDQSPVNLTISGNIRSIEKLAGVLSAKIEPDSLKMLEALTCDSLINALGFNRHTFLAMIIPNTYEVYWDISPKGLLHRLHREYFSYWTENRQAKAAAIGLSKEEVSILASIVQEETNMKDEMPRVAGVYLNRLQLGMPLQADPTVKFAVGDFSLRRILNKHLEVNSPYNTYRNVGLPPGPISLPSKAALNAVLNFEDHNYLYFCAKPDFSGYHNFASNLSQHNRNAAAYRRAL